jgi:hypothetical protein
VDTSSTVHETGGYCWSTPSAENYASDMPSLKAQKSLESNAVTAAVSRGKRMTNSIRAFIGGSVGGAETETQVLGRLAGFNLPAEIFQSC